SPIGQPGNPRPGRLVAPVAQRQSIPDPDPYRLLRRRELEAIGAPFESIVADGMGHLVSSLCPVYVTRHRYARMTRFQVSICIKWIIFRLMVSIAVYEDALRRQRSHVRI